ncbi:MAG: urease accessory protein UreE [Rhodobacteraceae bacterium]|nr:urease accessory protein UreE [Paracoccaceae bacterium]
MTSDQTPPLPRIVALHDHGHADDRIALTHEDRLLRRKRLRAASGLEFLADFPKATELQAGAVLVLSTGDHVQVVAAPEPLLEVRGDLPRLAWHIGNRHAPCEIRADALRIRHDHVMADMLRRLGAVLLEIDAPFTPEGGAYGHGRTFGHDHGAHGHSHD